MADCEMNLEVLKKCCMSYVIENMLNEKKIVSFLLTPIKKEVIKEKYINQ
jgi:hypothetical protein